MSTVSAPDDTIQLSLDAPILALTDVPGISLCAAACGDGTVSIIPLAADSQVITRQIHKGAVLDIAHHRPSGAFITTGDDGRVCRVLPDGEYTEVAHLGDQWIEHLQIDPATGWVAVAAGSRPYLISPDLQTVVPQGQLPSTITGLGFDPVRGHVVASHYGGVSAKPIHQPEADWTRFEAPGAHLAVSVSPDGRWLITATLSNSIHIWPLDGGKPMELRGYLRKPLSLSWRSDAKLLITSGTDGCLAWLFDGPGPKGRNPVEIGWGGGSFATKVASHSSAPVAVTGFDDGSVLVADLSELTSGILKPADGSEVTALAWASEGTALITGQLNGALTVFSAL